MSPPVRVSSMAWRRQISNIEESGIALTEWEQSLLTSCRQRISDDIDLTFYQSKSLRSIHRRIT